MAANKILAKFPSHLSPRDVQKNALLELEKNWDNADIFVVNLPVASGKSAIAMTIAKWAKKASIITPSKLLVNQYKDEYSSVQVLRGKKDYYCQTYKCPMDKRPKKKNEGRTCKKEWNCEGCQQYLEDLRKSRVMPYLISNYYVYMAHKLYRDTLIIDEAHQLISMLKNMARKKIWWHKFKFPHWAKDRESIKKWVNEKKGWELEHYPILRQLKEELNSRRPKYLVRRGYDSYRGEDEELIYMEPLDISKEPPFMWPSHVKKVVLMSATISTKDIEQMGLSGKKLVYIEADSPITYERRPVIVPAESASMAFRVMDTNLPKLTQFIKSVASQKPDEKGLVHATYALAKALRKTELGRDPRFIWHDAENKTAQYQHFRDSSEPKILVASGMYEGIDLPYDAGRWQILAKVPWPSLADPAIKYMSEIDPDYYAWETIKTVLQACGRICRTPEDYGVTYVFDDTFRRLYNDNKDQFFPLWMVNSVTLESPHGADL